MERHLLNKRIDSHPATPFQKRVWKALLRIPPGETRCYEWVAVQAGSPKAVRAAGQAVGKNPFAPEVPCHRVIRKDGSLGGYAGGLKKKIALLKREGVEVKDRDTTL